MRLRNRVFDSKSEIRVFRSLKARWSPAFTIYPQLPLSKIVDVDPQELDQGERRYFYSTNVDYTLCQAGVRPILSIEFDGVGGGFSRDGVYIQGHAADDPNRKLKMDFKLKVTKTVDYPFIVVSYEEIEKLDKEDSLTILDGIIGQFLARQEFQKRIKETVEESQAEIEVLPESERHEYIQDLVDWAEVEAELELDPIARKASDYQVRS